MKTRKETSFFRIYINGCLRVGRHMVKGVRYRVKGKKGARHRAQGTRDKSLEAYRLEGWETSKL